MKVVINARTKEIKEEKFIPQELTKEQIRKRRENEIKTELENLDKTINRATEDLYVLSNLTPYEGITKVINRKNELRQELGDLND